MMSKRTYIPEVGEQIKFKLFEHYAKRGLTIWAWLKVKSIHDMEKERPWVLLDVMDASKVVGEARGLLEDLQPPLGWKTEYEVCIPRIEAAVKFVNEWFKTGITVWASHDLGSPGMAFTPKGQEPGHWRYTKNPVEHLSPKQCEELITVKLSSRWFPDLPPTSEKHKRAKAIKALRDSGVEVYFVPNGMGGREAECRKVEDFYTPPDS